MTEETTTTYNYRTTACINTTTISPTPFMRLEPAKGKPTRDTFRHGSPFGRCEPPPFQIPDIWFAQCRNRRCGKVFMIRPPYTRIPGGVQGPDMCYECAAIYGRYEAWGNSEMLDGLPPHGEGP